MDKDRMASLHRVLASMRNKSWNKQSMRLIEDPAEGVESSENKFLYEIEELRDLLLQMDQDVKEIKKKQNDVINNPNPDLDRKALEAMSGDLKRKVGEIRIRIKNVGGPGTPKLTVAQQRIIQTQHSALLHHFMDSLNAYNEAQLNYQDRCKARMKRQLEITGRSIPEEDMERVMDDRRSFRVFAQSILFETKEAKKTLSDLEDRHEDILRLEKSIVELHDMFIEMRDLVAVQGETVDRIDLQVSAAAEYVDSSGKQLNTARISKDKYHRKKIFLIVAGLVIIGLIVLVITLACL